MFLHIGSDVVVPLREVIAILDAELLERSQAVRDLVSLQQAERRVTDIAGGRPRSIVLTDRGVFLSPISTVTLRRRGALIQEQGGT